MAREFSCSKKVDESEASCVIKNELVFADQENHMIVFGERFSSAQKQPPGHAKMDQQDIDLLGFACLDQEIFSAPRDVFNPAGSKPGFETARHSKAQIAAADDDIVDAAAFH